MINDIKKDKRILFILIVILFLTIGLAVAYFQGQIGTGATANVTVNAKTTDVLTFSKGNDINITATQQNFYSGAGNLNGSTTAVASLRANSDSNSATQTYNLYLNIEHNNFVYTTAPTNTPELLLTITDPSGNPVTSITGLTYTTVNGVSGFDITTKKGLMQLASNYSITSSSSTTATNQSWNITVTFVNLNSDQQLNTGKRFSGQAIIQKDEVTTAMMDTGQNVNAKMKTLANNGTVVAYDTENTNITTIARATSLPSGFTATAANTVSTSTIPIYMWYDSGTIHYYSEADIIYLNANSSYLFSYLENLANINDLAYVNTSYVTNMYDLFDNCYNLSSIAAISNWDVSSVTNMGSIFFNDFNLLSIDAISNWDVSSVTDMNRLFTWCGNLSSLLPISNWDVSSVTDMSYMFYGLNNITSIAPLANWDVSSVTTMSALFYQCSSLTNLVGLENWDVSSVTDMADMFGNCSGLTTLTPLANWDVSSVTTMGAMFFYSTVANIDALANWDVSSVTSMRYMFAGCNISNLDALANWDVSSVTNMQFMFYSCIYLTDASAINDWDITHVLYTNNSENNNNFWNMFIYSNNVHPTFSKRSGTWDANGTFIPSA